LYQEGKELDESNHLLTIAARICTSCAHLQTISQPNCWRTCNEHYHLPYAFQMCSYKIYMSFTYNYEMSTYSKGTRNKEQQ